MAGLYLNVVSAPAFSRVEEEYGIIGRELENGADGVIVALCDTSDLGGRLSELVSEDRVVLIDSDLDLEGDTRSCSRMPRRSEKPSPR